MGAQQSLDPGKAVYRCVVQNDGILLKDTLRAGTGQHSPAPHTDRSGRTALHVAAALDYHECARLLLEYGADVHFMNSRDDALGGTPLHEATRGCHEAMAELLLIYGANPFVCNALGRTCMDEAVLHSSSNLLRKFEQLATWQGDVAVKVKKLAGMSEAYKSRRFTIIPVTPFPDPKSPDARPTVRHQLRILKNGYSTTPRACVWLDGAHITRISRDEAVLRLRPSHKMPSGSMVTRYERGYSIHLRSLDTTPTNIAYLDQLEQLINMPEQTHSPRQMLPSALASLRPAATALMLSVLSSSAHTDPRPNSPPLIRTMPTQPTTTPRTPILPRPRNHNEPTTTLTLTPSTSISTSTTTSIITSSPTHTPLTVIQAIPLTAPSPASIVQPPSHLTQPTPTPTLPAGQSPHPPTPTLAQAITQHPTPPANATHVTVRHDVLTSPIAHLLNTPNTPPDGPGPMAAARMLLANRPPRAPTATGAVVVAAVPIPPATSTALTCPTSPYLNSTCTLLAAQISNEDCCPSAPPLPPAVNEKCRSLSSDDEYRCIICLTSPREAGYLHGASLHLCVCRDCCKSVRPGAPCPLCRQPVERIIDVF